MAKGAAARPVSMESGVDAPGRGGLVAFQQRRKAGSRESLLAAAASAFTTHGYFPVSVEDIASAAGVSRMTFYRHFGSKAEIAAALFAQTSGQHMPQLLAIGARDFTDPHVVSDWIAEIFADDREHRQLLKVFIEANVVDAGFAEQGHGFIRELALGLGERIPAFAIDPQSLSDRRRWIEAWLLLYEILDQSNHAARDSGLATDPLMIDILAKRFLGFTSRATDQPE